MRRVHYEKGGMYRVGRNLGVGMDEGDDCLPARRGRLTGTMTEQQYKSNKGIMKTIVLAVLTSALSFTYSDYFHEPQIQPDTQINKKAVEIIQDPAILFHFGSRLIRKKPKLIVFSTKRR
jgi:hypothetical protein